MEFSSCVQGREGAFGKKGCNCNYCIVHTSDLHGLVPSPMRTLKLLNELSHSFDPTHPIPFTCRGCNKHFDNPGDVTAELEPVDSREYTDSHFGQMWHRPPLLHIEPDRYVVCVLHLLLSCTKLLFKKGILEMLETEKQAEVLNTRLQILQVCVPKQRKLSANVAHDQSSRVKLTGKECVTLLENWDNLIDEIMSLSEHPGDWVLHVSQT